MASVQALPSGTTRAAARATADAWLVSASALHLALVLTWPSLPLLALGLWWHANTISHNFIHRPFFRARIANSLFSVYLSAVAGIPQSIWRSRHLAHHADRPHRLRWTPQTLADLAAVVAVWSVLALGAPAFFVTVYLPAWAIGLSLCQVHGYFEHARGTTSHYGRLYNFLFFNDGYHVEHHARPGLHWTALPQTSSRAEQASRWPAVLRWFEASPRDVMTRTLDALERLVLRSRTLQRLVCDAHARAIERLIGDHAGPDSPIRRVLIVGGGLFPRTALVLARLLPRARLTIIDVNEQHLNGAAAFLRGDVQLDHTAFDPSAVRDFDLVVIPLAFIGDRRQIYARPPARRVLVHDWLWSRQGRGAVVSLALLKRVNLIETCDPSRSPSS